MDFGRNKVISLIVMGVIAVAVLILNLNMIFNYIEASRFQKYDRITAEITNAHNMTSNIRESASTSSNMNAPQKILLDVYQTLDISYEYKGQKFNRTLKDINVYSGSFSSRTSAEKELEYMDSRLYQTGGSIDIYTNGIEVTSQAVADDAASPVIFVVLAIVDLVVAGIGFLVFKFMK